MECSLEKTSPVVIAGVTSYTSRILLSTQDQALHSPQSEFKTQLKPYPKAYIFEKQFQAKMLRKLKSGHLHTKKGQSILDNRNLPSCMAISGLEGMVFW